MKFSDFDLKDTILTGLQDVRYEETTPIQEKSIPLVLEGHDVIGAAQTGTGKTGAFVIPLLQKILENRDGNTQALILSPTRELARQIDEQIFAIGYHSGINSATVIGGSDFSEQAKALRAGVDVIVATPGRLLDQMNVLDIDFSHLKYLVLDEADRMLDMGFLPDVKKIVDGLPKKRQTLLFSATMADEIEKVVKEIMRNPKRIELKVSKPVDSVEQRIYFVHPKKKLNLIEALFDELDWESTIIFTATKRGTDELERLLKKRNIKAVSMHGDRSQEERNEALRAFKNRQFPVMVATDVLARGIDIDKVSVIINYNVPNSPDDYIHRIGRTGRYDQKGLAITFVTNRERKYYEAIKKIVGDQLNIKELPAELNEQTSKKQNGRSKPPKKSDEPEHKQTKSRPEKQKALKRHGDKSKEDGRNSQKEEKPVKSRSAGKSQKQRSEKRASSSKRSTQKRQKQPAPRPVSPPDVEIVEKAVARNKKARKPAKGMWGIVKSFIPRFKK